MEKNVASIYFSFLFFSTASTECYSIPQCLTTLVFVSTISKCPWSNTSSSRIHWQIPIHWGSYKKTLCCNGWYCGWSNRKCHTSYEAGWVSTHNSWIPFIQENTLWNRRGIADKKGGTWSSGYWPLPLSNGGIPWSRRLLVKVIIQGKTPGH